MSKKDKTKVVLDLSSGIPGEIVSILDENRCQVINSEELVDVNDLSYIFIDHEGSAVELLQKYDTLKKDIKIISLSQVNAQRDFFLCNGRASFDINWLKYDIGKIMFTKFINEANSLHIDELFSGIVGEINTSKIINHNRLGYYSDNISLAAFQNNFNVVSIRSYIDHYIYYLTYLKQAGVSSVPFEVEYAHSKDFFVVLIHCSMINFVAEYLIDCFGEENPNDPLSFLLKASSRSCDFFDLNFVDTASKLCSIAVWKNLDNKKLKELEHSVLFNNVRTSGQILSMIEDKIRAAKEAGPQTIEKENFEDAVKKVEAKKLPGNIIEMVVSPDENSTFHSKPKLASQLIAFSIAEFEEMHPGRDLKTMKMEELKDILSRYKDQEVIENLNDEDHDHLLERIHKHSISSVYEDEVSRVRSELQDDEDFQKKLSSGINDDIVDQIAEKMNVGMVNNAITRGNWDEEVMVIGGKSSDDPNSNKTGGNWNDDKITVKGGSSEKEFKPIKLSGDDEDNFIEKVGGNLKKNAKEGNFFTPDHHRQLDKEIDNFINDLPDMEGSAKDFLSQNVPPAIHKKIAEHAEKIGKSVDELDEDEVTMFVQSALRETLREQQNKYNAKNQPKGAIKLTDLLDEQLDEIKIPDDHPIFPPSDETKFGLENPETHEIIPVSGDNDIGFVDQAGNFTALEEGDRIVPIGNGEYGMLDENGKIRPLPNGKNLGFISADGKVMPIDEYYNFVSLGGNGEAIKIPKIPDFKNLEDLLGNQDPEIDPTQFIPENVEVSKNFRKNFQEHLKQQLKESGKDISELDVTEFKTEKIQTMIKGSIRKSLDDEFKLNSLNKDKIKASKNDIINILSPSFEMEKTELDSIFDENVNKATLKENQEITKHLFKRGGDADIVEGLPEGHLVEQGEEGKTKLVQDPNYVPPESGVVDENGVETITKMEPVLDDQGQPLLDENGQPVVQEVIVQQVVEGGSQESTSNSEDDKGTHFEQTALINRLGEYEDQLQEYSDINKQLNNKIAVLEADLKAKQDVLDIKDDIEKNAEEYVRNQNIESDFNPPTLAEQVELNRIKESLKNGETLKQEQVQLINQMMSKEAKMVEYAKEHDRNMKKANMEFGRKEMLFNAQIEKARKDARTKEKVLERAKEGLAMLNKKKDDEIRKLRSRLDAIQKQGLATNNAKQDFQLKQLEQDKSHLEKSVEMYKQKFNQAMNQATKQINAMSQSHSATELRRLEKVKAKLENDLVEKDKLIQEAKQQAVQAPKASSGGDAEVEDLKKKIEELEKKKAEEIRLAVEKTTKDMEAMFEAAGGGAEDKTSDKKEKDAEEEASAGGGNSGKELTKAKEQVAELKKESLQKDQKNKQLEAKVKEMEKTLQALDKGGKGAVSPVKYKQMETNYNKMKKDFKKNEEEVKKSRSELTRLKTSKATLENKVKDLEKQLAKAKGKKAA